MSGTIVESCVRRCGGGVGGATPSTTSPTPRRRAGRAARPTSADACARSVMRGQPLHDLSRPPPPPPPLPPPPPRSLAVPFRAFFLRRTRGLLRFAHLDSTGEPRRPRAILGGSALLAAASAAARSSCCGLGGRARSSHRAATSAAARCLRRGLSGRALIAPRPRWPIAPRAAASAAVRSSRRGLGGRSLLAPRPRRPRFPRVAIRPRRR